MLIVELNGDQATWSVANLGSRRQCPAVPMALGPTWSTESVRLYKAACPAQRSYAKRRASFIALEAHGDHTVPVSHEASIAWNCESVEVG